MHVVHSAVPDSRRRERVSLCATARSGCGQCDSAWVRAVRQRTHPQSRRSRRRRRPTSPSLSDRVVSWRLTERVVLRSLSVGAGQKKRTVLAIAVSRVPSLNTQFCNTRRQLSRPAWPVLGMFAEKSETDGFLQWVAACSQKPRRPASLRSSSTRAPKYLPDSSYAMHSRSRCPRLLPAASSLKLPAHAPSHLH